MKARSACEGQFGPRACSSDINLGKVKQGNTSTVPQSQHGVGEEPGVSRTGLTEPELEEFWRPTILEEARAVLYGLRGYGSV